LQPDGMTESITLTEALRKIPSDSGVQTHPSDVLINLIVALLAPMFLSPGAGDIQFARMAALETVNAYCARNHADLIAIAQVIACGLAALGSLSLSMADNLSLSMTLRLRGNAVALNRAAEQNRRSLRQPRPDTATLEQPEPTIEAEDPFAAGTDDARYEAEVVASVAAARKRTAEAQGHLLNAERAARQAPILPASSAAVPPVEAPAFSPTTAPATTDQQSRAMWASAMADVAGEFTADLEHLPPEERRMASRRAAVLSSCANQLISGNVPPPPKPGDRPTVMRPNTD
jgi:hypothetical protein